MSEKTPKTVNAPRYDALNAHYDKVYGPTKDFQESEGNNLGIPSRDDLLANFAEKRAQHATELADKRSQYEAELAEAESVPGFRRVYEDKVEIAGVKDDLEALNDIQSTVNEEWNLYGGEAIDAAQAEVDALNFRSDANDHITAKAKLKAAKDAFYENFKAAAEVQQSAPAEDSTEVSENGHVIENQNSDTRQDAENAKAKEEESPYTSDHANAAAEAASQAGDIDPLFGRNARHEANAQKPVTPETEDATTAHTPEAHAAAAAEAQGAAKVDEAPATPEAKQDSDDITEAIDEVVETIAGDGQEGDAEQEDKVETRRARQGKKLANWVMKKLNRAKQIYKYSARAKNVKNIQQKAQNPSRMDSLIAASEQIAAEKSEDENYAPLTKKDFNFRSRHGIGKRAKERDPIYEEAARRLDGVAENEDEIQTEPMTNIDGGAVESPADTQRTEVIDTARLPAAPTAGEVLRQQREQNPFYNYDLAPEAKVRDNEVVFDSKPGDQVQLTQYEAAEMKQLDEFTYELPGYEGRWRVLAGTEKFERLPDEENNESAA
jgi:hypothetical protein